MSIVDATEKKQSGEIIRQQCMAREEYNRNEKMMARKLAEADAQLAEANEQIAEARKDAEEAKERAEQERTTLPGLRRSRSRVSRLYTASTRCVTRLRTILRDLFPD